MSPDGAIVSEIEQKLEAAIRKHIRPIKAKKMTARVRKRREKSLFVIYGEHAFCCSVGPGESLQAHAIKLSKAVHVLQRMMTRTEWSSEGGEFWDGYREHANIGLDFLSGMVAEMLEASEEALSD